MNVPSPLAAHWTLEEGVCFLNHGSFGACPREVLAAQRRIRERLEAQPVRFFMREYQDLLDAARERIAAFIGGEPEGLAFVPNATTGVSTVLRSLDFEPGDQLLRTNHIYGACANALDAAAARSGAEVVVADLPLPSPDADALFEGVMARVTARTRLALIDAVTSPTALVMPWERLTRALQDRGVAVLLDAAHAPGMIPFDLSTCEPAFATANCHKWLCAPKGAAVLHVRADWRDRIRPLTVSHGATVQVPEGRSRFHAEHDWTGTQDPSAWLSIPAALDVMARLGGGWEQVRHTNRALALTARRLLCDGLGVEPPCPEALVGSMALVPLPDTDDAPPRPNHPDPLQDRLWHDHRIEVPIIRWPTPRRRWVRVSAQLYNARGQYEHLLEALHAIGTRL